MIVELQCLALLRRHQIPIWNLRKSKYRLQAQLEPDQRQHVKIINLVKILQYHHLTIPCGRIWRRKARRNARTWNCTGSVALLTRRSYTICWDSTASSKEWCSVLWPPRPGASSSAKPRCCPCCCRFSSPSQQQSVSTTSYETTRSTSAS